MRIIGKENVSPLYFCMENNQAVILYKDESLYYLKFLQAGKNVREPNRTVELNAVLLSNSCRQTIELGKILIEKLFTKETEEAKEKLAERK
jgi:hypothetical protein